MTSGPKVNTATSEWADHFENNPDHYFRPASAIAGNKEKAAHPAALCHRFCATYGLAVL
jgi:hypothetical protein